MDIEKIRRKRAIKVLIADLIMTVSVVVIVSILVAVVAGWRVNSDFTVEQNGLVSIKTEPTGAKVIIDDEKQSQDANMSKMLTGGEHKIVLQKDGYESWEKVIEITPGWLYRLEYPKLIKQDREREELKVFANLKFFYVSSDRTTAIYAEENTTEWTLVSDLNGTPKYKTINLQGLFTGTEDSQFNLKIKYLEWSGNAEKILINVASDEVNEWAVINLNNIDSSVNLTKKYAEFNKNGSSAALADSSSIKITDAKFEDNAGEKVLGLIENKIMRIDLSSKLVTTILDDVESFNFRENEIVYLSSGDKNGIRLFRIGEEDSVVVTEVGKDENVSFALTKFNSENYLLYTIDDRLFIYRATDYPRSNEKISKMKLIAENDLGINPTEVINSRNDEFIIFRESARVVVFDAELEKWTEYDYGDEKVRFLDEYLMYRVNKASGKFMAWDFDGENVRTMVVDHGDNNFDALFSKNGKYFYYIGKYTDSEATYYKLLREKL